MRPGMHAGRAALALLALALASGAFPEARKLATLDEIAAAGRESSLEYAKAVNAAVAAGAAVPALVTAKSSTLTAGYSYAGAGSATTGSGSATGGFSASATVPLLDQIGISASVSQNLSSQVSATMSPLAHSDARAQARIAYEKALAAADGKGRAAGLAAVKAALAWMGQRRQTATQRNLTLLKEDAYNAAKAGNALDPVTITLDDLVAALKDWSDSRTEFVKAQAAARKTETDLHAALGASRGEVEVAALDLAGLSAVVDALKSSLAAAATSGPAESYPAKAAVLDVASGKARLASIWAFEPDLSLSAGVSLPATGPVAPLASVKLTISLDNLKGEKRSEARADLDVAVRTLVLQKSSDADAYDQAVAAVQAAKLNTESRKLARDQAAELAEVAEFYHNSGSCSAIENETAALALAAADDAHYQALADECAAWLDLGALAGK